ncbi:hypothetical protein [Dapis sp. BLCC M229]|uniref:hypothetical protein n=1 Tax=Dapis sp. BLCC M229 TaxID=3400188 RepID=UPI003CF78917
MIIFTHAVQNLIFLNLHPVNDTYCWYLYQVLAKSYWFGIEAGILNIQSSLSKKV